MGTTAEPYSARRNLADALFSKTQQRVLGLLFGEPGRSFYAAELISRARGGTGTVLRELARLEASGIVTARRVGNRRHFQANSQSPIFGELCGIIEKTVGLTGPIQRSLDPLAPRITAAFVYGSVAAKRDTAHSDIDLLIISDKTTYGDLYAALESANSMLGRPVNPTLYTKAEFAKRVKARNPFVMKVLSRPKVWIIGSEDDLAA